MTDYTYLGDRLTRSDLRGGQCNAIRRNGKCIRSPMGSMFVQFDNGEKHVVIGRLLRRNDKLRGKA